MSYSSDLLDGFEFLYKRTDGVLKTTADLSSFVSKLSKVEKEYARNLGKLVKSQRADFQKLPSIQKEVSTTYYCWDNIFGLLDQIADHHSDYADKLENELSKSAGNYARESQKTRKKLEGDGTKLTKDFKTAQENLVQSRRKYVALSKEADAAEGQHTKGKGDMNMKPSQLAKFAAKASQTSEKATSADSEYQSTLSATNQKQNEFYGQTMPALLTEFQKFEEDRLKFQKDIAQKLASLIAEKPPFFTTIAQSMNSAADGVSIEQDLQAFVAENKTNVTAPTEQQYMRYDADVPGQPTKSAPKVKSPKYTPGGKDSSELLTRQWGIGQHENLSDDQKVEKLRNQLAELDKAITSENKKKDGLENLIRFYSKDPVSAKKAEEEMQDAEQKLRKLTEIRNNTVQTQLEALGGSAPGLPSQPFKVRGVYDYVATCDTELSFKEGDILMISEKDESGWWYAQMGNKAGFVPNNYVEPIQ